MNSIHNFLTNEILRVISYIVKNLDDECFGIKHIKISNSTEEWNWLGLKFFYHLVTTIHYKKKTKTNKMVSNTTTGKNELKHVNFLFSRCDGNLWYHFLIFSNTNLRYSLLYIMMENIVSGRFPFWDSRLRNTSNNNILWLCHPFTFLCCVAKREYEIRDFVAHFATPVNLDKLFYV